MEVTVSGKEVDEEFTVADGASLKEEFAKGLHPYFSGQPPFLFLCRACLFIPFPFFLFLLTFIIYYSLLFLIVLLLILLVCMLSHVQLFVNPWTVACQAPLSMKFSRQNYWSGLPFPSPGDLPDSGIKPASLASPALVGGFVTTCATWKASFDTINHILFYVWPHHMAYRILVPQLGIKPRHSSGDAES